MESGGRDVERTPKQTPKRSSKQAAKRRPAKPPAPRSNKAAQWGGVITSLIKLGGLVLAVNEALFSPAPHDAIVFAIAAFMMAGAQGIDSLISSVVGGSHREEDESRQ